MLRDAEFGPVRLRAFGSYSFQVTQAGEFLTKIVGTDGHFTIDEIESQLRDLVTSRFADALGELKVPALDLAAHYNELGDDLLAKMQPEFADYGLEVTKLLIENISLPEEVEKALDKRTSMGVIGNLGAYTQFQSANAIEAAAKSGGGGGGASEGLGLGMGFAMAQQMANAMSGQGQQQGGQQGAPPPLPQGAQYFVAINGQQSGPHGLDALRQHAAGGTLTRETLVWKQGMSAWTPAGQVDELSQLFGSVPPPLPG
jgi:membrane protease subunit (stomatin/prohibitin family)